MAAVPTSGSPPDPVAMSAVRNPSSIDLRTADSIVPERRGAGQAGETDRGPEVGEQAEMFAEREEGGALGLLVRRHRFPFRSPDRTERDRVGRFTGRQRFAPPPTPASETQ